MKMMREQAIGEVLKQIAPQMFSSDRLLNPNAEKDEQGDIDELKLANLTPEMLQIYEYESYRAKYYHVRMFEHEAELDLRGSNAIGAFRAKQAENIIIGLGSGTKKGSNVRHHGFLAQKLQGKPEFEEVENDGGGE